MKKQTIRFLLAGNLCMCFARLTHSFIHLSEDIRDFLTGFGVGVIIAAFIFDKSTRSACGTVATAKTKL